MITINTKQNNNSGVGLTRLWFLISWWVKIYIMFWRTRGTDQLVLIVKCKVPWDGYCKTYLVYAPVTRRWGIHSMKTYLWACFICYAVKQQRNDYCNKHWIHIWLCPCQFTFVRRDQASHVHHHNIHHLEVGNFFCSEMQWNNFWVFFGYVCNQVLEDNRKKKASVYFTAAWMCIHFIVWIWQF